MQPDMRTPPTAAGMIFAMLIHSQQRGLFIAEIAAVVEIVGFFTLPFYGYSYSNPDPAFVYAFVYGGWLCGVAFFCAVAAGGLTVWRAISTRRNAPVNRATATFFTTFITIFLGGVSALLLLIAIVSADSGPSNRSEAGYSFGPSWGGWILLLAAIGIAVGGLMQRNTKS
jgi:hypothetical protein